MGERAGGNLERLSKDLSRSSTHESPEEFIRNTLLAHGFFNHAGQRSKDVAMEDKPSETLKAGGTKEKPGCGISEEDRRRTTQLVSHYREGKEFHSLKEPRSLFAQPAKKQHQKNLPLWPAEVECLPNRPRFLSSPPPHREPFYIPDHEVLPPKVRSGEGGGTVVYTNQPGPEKYFVRARAGPSVNLKATPTCSANSTSLIFESRFESGNLAKAVQVGRWDYELYLRFDLYTSKHTQWFFFSVSNMKAGQTYRFTIVNLYKASSLYNEGMQPVMYSEVDAKSQHLGWRRAGFNITYFKTPLRRADTRQEAYYYGLTWSYTFQHTHDTCYFAHCYPYTYSDMQDHLYSLLSHPEKALFCKQRTLCHSIAGNPLPILTITSPVSSPHENKVKRAVVVTARVHPGETNGSWMMKGLLDFLTGPSPDAQILRQMFIFKVVPMLNPDGVIVGNYRCSLAGRDLNRNYRSKLREAYPSVWHTKNMVRRLVEEREVVVYCDLHGHSRKQNVFIYGCDMMADPAVRLRARVFPRMLSKNAPTKFSYKESRFGVQKSKEGTGRVVMWREMGVRNSYTMEATFCGSLLGREKRTQFSTADLGAMGYHFCDTLLDYCDPDQSKVEHILHELEEEYRQSVLSKLATLGQEVPPGVDPLDLVLESDLESSDAGSDSSDLDGPPVHLVGKERKKRRKKLKSRRERNKHKVLLKLTHHKSQSTPQHVQQAAHQIQLLPPPYENVATDAGGGARQPSLGATPYRYSPMEVARNGGIPIFIQERIEERQKRRSDVESSERLADDVDYIRAMVTEYLSQGLPHGLVTEATSQDLRSSLTSLIQLPRPPCPMNIAAMPLCEGRSGPGQSRTASRTSLPHLEDPAVLNATSSHQHSGSRAAFTSQYMANHLRDVIASPSDIIASPSGTQLPPAGHQSVNSTKNLENLSRLFRQLRPHLLQTVSREARVSHHHLSRPEMRGQLPLDTPRGMRIEEKDPPRAGVYLPGKKVEGSSHGVGDVDAERVPQSKVKHLKEENVHLRRSDKDTSHTSDDKVISPGNLEQVSGPTNHDRNVAANVRTSFSSLSSSPATSSWESFSKPMKLSERERECSGQQPAHWEFKEPPKVSFDATLPEDLDVSHPGPSRYNSLLTTLAEERSPQRTAEWLGPIPKSSSAPNPSTYLLHHHQSVDNTLPNLPPPTTVQWTDGPLAKAHKRQVAEAVESMLGGTAGRKPLKEPQRGEVRLSLPTTATSVAFQATHVHPSKSHSSALALPPPSSSPSSLSLSSTVYNTLPPPEMNTSHSQEDTNMFSSHPHTSSSKAERYVPATTNHVFSSKPPSRYGRRPTADDGMLPSTISLMLSGRVKPRPTTMHSQHRPRPLHIRYFTKKTTSFYLD